MSVGGSDLGGSPPPVIRRSPESLAELQGLRGEELTSISKRLGRLSGSRWDRWFGGAFVLLLGGVIGGGFALIPFLSTNPAPSAKAKIIYFGALALCSVVALVCGFAALAIKGERDESVTAIREDLDRILGTYGLEEPSDGEPRATGPARRFLDRLRITAGMPGVRIELGPGGIEWSGDALEVIRATYGATTGAGAVADVTDTVRTLVQDGRLSITADNGTLGGDPAPNEVKTFYIEYRIAGSADIFQATFAEGSRIEIPGQSYRV
jgi:hypothetical protein